jgi:hypothetical protein
MIGKHKTIFKELPIEQIELDGNQPRKNTGDPAERMKLCNSIKQFGLQEPISVVQKDDNRYVIIEWSKCNALIRDKFMLAFLQNANRFSAFIK